MSTTLSFTTTRKSSQMNLVEGWLSGGSIKVYTTPRPATSDTAITTQTLLVTITLPDPAGTVTNGVFTSASISQATVTNTGSAVWCRVFDSSSNAIFDADVGVTSSGAFLETSNVTLTQGGYMTVANFTISNS